MRAGEDPMGDSNCGSLLPEGAQSRWTLFERGVLRAADNNDLSVQWRHGTVCRLNEPEWYFSDPCTFSPAKRFAAEEVSLQRVRADENPPVNGIVILWVLKSTSVGSPRSAGQNKRSFNAPADEETHDELFDILTLIQTGNIRRRPLVLFGTKFWIGLISWLR